MLGKEFLHFLKEKKLLNDKEIKSLLEEKEKTKKSFEEIILDKKILSEKDLYEKKAEFLKIPLWKIPPEEALAEVFREIPEEVAREYKIVPLEKENRTLKVGAIEPENFSVLSYLRFLEKEKDIKIKLYLITPQQFKKFLKGYRSLEKEIKIALERLKKEKVLKEKKVEKKVITEAPIAKIVNTILMHGIEGKASDIHIEPYKDKMRVRYRVDGVLYSSLFLPKHLLPSIVARIKIMAGLKIEETRIPQDGRFQIEKEGKKIDFRVGTFPVAGGEKVALRILDPSAVILEFEKLGFMGKNLKLIKEVFNYPFGSVVICGPTGSGKTTTLYTILSKLNTDKINIVTLEDPVEYVLPGINQSQVKPEIGYDFASGLREIVRQDPDVIMVGEVRDQETAELATHAALTGHLVFLTVHANTAPAAIPRLLDLGVPKFLLPATVRMIISQRLVRRLCPFCKRKDKPNQEELKVIEKEIAKMPKEERPSPPFYVWRPQGCKKCNFKGKKGRIAVHEILKMTKNLEEIILRGGGLEEIEKEAQNQGMITMRQDGILKALKGIIDIDEILHLT